MTYFLAATAASGIFIVAGRRSKQEAAPHSVLDRNNFPTDRQWCETEQDDIASHAQADAGAAIRLALKRLSPLMIRHSVQAEVAAPPGLLVRMPGPILADLLEELITAAIHGAPASRLLLTATPQGDRIQLSVTDDMPHANAAVRIGSVRSLMERVALRGGALDVDVRPKEGTSMTLRFAAAITSKQDAKHEAPPVFTDAAST